MSRAAAGTGCKGACAGKGLLSPKWDMREAVLPFPDWFVPSGIVTVRPGNGFPALPQHGARSPPVGDSVGSSAEGPVWMQPQCQGPSAAGLV